MLVFLAHLLVYLTIIVIIVINITIIIVINIIVIIVITIMVIIVITINITTIIVIIIKQIESGHLSVVELVAHDTVALRVKSCNSRRVIRDFLVKRSVHLFVLSARLGTTLQERPTQGTARELPSP